jgi:hypothetical protein
MQEKVSSACAAMCVGVLETSFQSLMRDSGNFSLFTLYVPIVKLVGKMNALVAHALLAKKGRNDSLYVFVIHFWEKSMGKTGN